MLQVNRTRTGAIPITLDQAKLFLRVDGTADDTLITALIEQSLDLIEEYLNTSIIEATVIVLASIRLTLELPYGPVISITTVQDQDGEDIDYTWNGFYISFASTSWSPTSPESWPYTESVTTFEAGYATLPKGLELAWMEAIAWLYENRGDNTGFVSMLSQNANLMPYRRKVWI